MIYRYTYEKESYHHIDIGSYTSYAVKVYKDSDCVEYLPDLFDEAKKLLDLPGCARLFIWNRNISMIF